MQILEHAPFSYGCGRDKGADTPAAWVAPSCWQFVVPADKGLKLGHRVGGCEGEPLTGVESEGRGINGHINNYYYCFLFHCLFSRRRL